MQHFEENEIRITLYLEDKMTPEEEAIFMKDLGQDEGLRQQYEEELFMQSVWSEKETDKEHLWLQPADEHIQMLESALTREKSRENKRQVIPLYGRLAMAAAAAVIILVTVLVVKSKKDGQPPAIVAGKTTPADTLTPGQQLVKGATPDTTLPRNPPIVNHPVEKGNPELATNDKKMDSVFDTHYTPYLQKDVPVEIRDYYNDYQDKEYAAVIAVKATDYQSMGAEDKHTSLQQYMQLYKGLSYLGVNDPSRALREFDSLLQSAGKNDERYYAAQWYSALAWLKNRNPLKASVIAAAITETNSPYKTNALHLLDALKRAIDRVVRYDEWQNAYVGEEFASCNFM